MINHLPVMVRCYELCAELANVETLPNVDYVNKYIPESQKLYSVFTRPFMC